MEKEMFYEMINDWKADNSSEYDKLIITEIKEENGVFEAIAEDDENEYLLTDDGMGNIIINYLGTFNRKPMEKDYGKVTFDGKEYTLTQDAYADNYKDRICYFASATDNNGNTFKIRWETTEEWDNANNTYQKLYFRQEDAKQGINYAEPLTEEQEEALYKAESFLQDESEACDWDDPAEVREI